MFWMDVDMARRSSKDRHDAFTEMKTEEGEGKLCTAGRKHAIFLLLSKPKRFLHGNRHLVVQRFVGLVRGQIETIEARKGQSRGTSKGDDRTHQVCDLGRAAGSPDFSMVNRRGPSEPWRSLNPLTGMREVPVVNWRRRDFCSASQLRTIFQKF